jgi:hypothetical protein
MYIAPNTNIRILKDVPLEPSYENTLYFSSLSAQTNYFSSKAKYSLTQNTYQRVNRGVIRVGVKADNLYDCNYVMFQNAGYGNKWFYAFILQVEFVNNTTADIYFGIDVMQTYAFDYTLKECMIERQHAESDEIGENLVPEGLETGEYVSENITNIESLKPNSIVIGVAATENAGDFYGGYFNGTYSGINYLAYPNTLVGAKLCQNKLELLTQSVNNKADSIVSLFLMPTEMVGTDGSELTVKRFLLGGDNPKSFNGYKPRNNKLFTEPYSFLAVSTRTGNSATYGWEFFNRGSAEDDYVFYYFGDTTPNPSVWLTPLNYKGLAVNDDEACVMTGFPQVAYTIDTYRAWVAQSSGVVAMNAMTAGYGAYAKTNAVAENAAAAHMTATIKAQQASANFAKTLSAANAAKATATRAAATEAGTASAAAAAAVGPAAIGAVALSVLGAVIEHARMPTVAKGIQSSMVWAGRKAMTFYFDHRHITRQFAEIIDSYFDMYGYAQHKVGVPNRNVRRHWTYVKTVGCAVVGSMPADDMRKIQEIFDAGIRFWNTPGEVGNYSLDNTL